MKGKNGHRMVTATRQEVLHRLIRLGVVLMGTMLYFVVSRAQVSEGSYMSNGYSPLKDTAAISHLIQVALAKRETGTDSAKILLYEALTASKQLGYRPGIAKCYYGLARCYSNQNNHEQALRCLQAGLRYCTDNKQDRKLAASIYLLASEVHYYKSQYDSCAYYRYKALNELEANKVDDPWMNMRVYTSILQFWLNTHEGIGNDHYMRQLMQRIDELEQLALQRKDSSLLANIYFYKGGFYNNIGKNDSARHYCNLTLSLGRPRKISPSMIVATLLNISITFIDDKQPGPAIAYIRKAIAEIPPKDKSTNRHLAFAAIFLGEAYVLEQKYDKAIAVTEQGLADMKKLGIISLTDKAHQTLAESYEALSMYEQANEHRKKYSHIRDSMMKLEKLEIAYQLEMKYQIAEKDKKLAQKELSITINKGKLRTKNLWIVVISTGMCLLFILSLLFFRNNKHKQRLQAEKIRNLQQGMEIDLLNAMMNGEEKERSRISKELHDGIGGLLSVARMNFGLAKKNMPIQSRDFTEGMDLLEEAAHELRKTAHNMMPETLLQHGLVEALQYFCMRMNKGRLLTIDYQAYGHVKQRFAAAFELSVYRMVQELVHNILKHADATHALVQINVTDALLTVTVEDNGKGIAGGLPERTAGMGLENVFKRVAALNGEIDFTSNPGTGTTVYLEFAAREKEMHLIN